MKKQITVRVNVTAADIKKGCASCEENCPINLATTRAVKKIFGRSKLDLILLAAFFVRTSGVPEVWFGHENQISSTTTMRSEEKIDAFIDAFDAVDEERKELAELQSELSKCPSADALKAIQVEISEQKEKVANYEEDIKPFSFDLSLDFS